MRYLRYSLLVHLLLVFVILYESTIEIEIVQELFTALDCVLGVVIQLKIFLEFCYDFRPDLFSPVFTLPLRDLQLFGLEHLAQDLGVDIGERILRENLVDLSEVVSLHYFILEDLNDHECYPDHYLLSLEKKCREDEDLCLVVDTVEEKCDKPLERYEVKLVVMVLHVRDQLRKLFGQQGIEYPLVGQDP